MNVACRTRLLSLCLLMFAVAIPAQASDGFLHVGKLECPGEYRLVFHDEFEAGPLDLSKWIVGTCNPQPLDRVPSWSGCGFDEVTYMHDDNVRFENGGVHFVTEQLAYNYFGTAGSAPCWPSNACGNYPACDPPAGTGAALDSDGCFFDGEDFDLVAGFRGGSIYSIEGWHYGRFEISAKIPNVEGLWAAFWLWNGREEIDVFEFLKATPEEFQSNVWDHATCEDCNDGKPGVERFQEPRIHDEGDFGSNFSFTDDFHVYSLEWSPFELHWAIDGQVFRSEYRISDVAGRQYGCGDEVPLGLYYEDPFFPETREDSWMHVALGDSTNPNRATETERLPASFEVQYVRVYRRLLPEEMAANDLCGLELSGSTEVCGSGEYTYTLEAAEALPAVTWTTSSHFALVDSSTTEVTVSVNQGTAGSGWIRATVPGSEAYCSGAQEARLDVRVGAEFQIEASSLGDICFPPSHPPARFTTNPSTTVSWSVDVGTVLPTVGTMAIVSPSSAGAFTLTGTATDACGVQTEVSQAFVAQECEDGP